MGQSVARALRAIDRHNARPEDIDSVILAAINVTLCLASGGDDRVAEGFNNDIAISGRSFRRRPSDRARPGRLERAYQVTPAAASLRSLEALTRWKKTPLDDEKPISGNAQRGVVVEAAPTATLAAYLTAIDRHLRHFTPPQSGGGVPT